MALRRERVERPRNGAEGRDGTTGRPGRLRGRTAAVWHWLLPTTLVAGLAVALVGAPAQTPPPTSQGQKATQTDTRSDKKPSSRPAAPVPLNKQATVLLDRARGRLLLKTTVVLREGLLEMLCCPKNTKEHESILALDGKAYFVHAGLLALGAKPGRPVQYTPVYRPPSGQRIDIFVNWRDEKGKLHRERAQRWIRHAIHRFYIWPMKKKPADLKLPPDSRLRYDPRAGELTWLGPMTAQQRDELLKWSSDPEYQKAIRTFYRQSQPREMDTYWVFVGSGFYVDPQTGQRYYMAEGGDLICVANFPSATIDVAIPSSPNGTENLLFEAYTERIPPLGTKVTLELIPAKEKAPPDQPPPASASDSPRPAAPGDR